MDKEDKTDKTSFCRNKSNEVWALSKLNIDFDYMTLNKSLMKREIENEHILKT